jgi:undecaprenyl-diphosphatase
LAFIIGRLIFDDNGSLTDGNRLRGKAQEASSMNWFDTHVTLFLNQFANHWPWFDWLVTRAYSTNLVGVGVTVALAWCALFDRKTGDRLSKDHELLLGAFFFCGVAALTARGLALSLPFRLRPRWTPGLDFHIPSASNTTPLMNWSSFPSDHAALLYALAVGIFFVSRRLGLFAIVWVATTISLPAIYLGVHWTTDVMVGACLGVGFAYCSKIPPVREAISRFTTSWEQRQLGVFFGVLFLWSYQLVTLFEDGRRLLNGIWHAI